MARARAANVAAYLRDQGLTGPITVSTERAAVHNVAHDRRVSVTIHYTA
jgi:hypothetical protein